MRFDKSHPAHICREIENVTRISRNGPARIHLPKIGANVFDFAKDLMPLRDGFAVDHAEVRVSPTKKLGD